MFLSNLGPPPSNLSRAPVTQTCSVNQWQKCVFPNQLVRSCWRLLAVSRWDKSPRDCFGCHSHKLELRMFAFKVKITTETNTFQKAQLLLWRQIFSTPSLHWQLCVFHTNYRQLWQPASDKSNHKEVCGLAPYTPLWPVSPGNIKQPLSNWMLNTHFSGAIGGYHWLTDCPLASSDQEEKKCYSTKEHVGLHFHSNVRTSAIREQNEAFTQSCGSGVGTDFRARRWKFRWRT